MLKCKTKRCTICKLRKPVAEFTKDSSRGDRLSSKCKVCAGKISAKWALENSERRCKTRQIHNGIPSVQRHNKDKKLRSLYGISIDDYDKMLTEQGGVCLNCGGSEIAVRGGKTLALAVDHDYFEGKLRVRGLLCGNCNRLVGICQEDISILEKTIVYLKKYK